ncbi:MAG: hypothetical protein IJ172_00480 [Ruminococcus sp.]|nr:hypothetical protein [Ruminococcus sp.]MBQ8119241.1 hypothetical protein [Ruminococcus sp.]
MITKAGKEFFSKTLIAGTIYFSSLKNTAGDTPPNSPITARTWFESNYAITNNAYNSGGLGLAMAVGSGDTEFTESSYWLSNAETDVVCNSCSVTANGQAMIVTAVFTNTSNSAKDIKEIGLMFAHYGSMNFLLAGKNVPIRTMQPNETATFSYEISFN